MFLRTLLLATLVSNAAYAADLDPERFNMTESNWNGAYVGISAGLAGTSGRTDLGTIAGDLINLDVSNGLFPRSTTAYDDKIMIGAEAGYDMQFGGFVAGVAADVSWNDAESFYTQNVIDPNPNAPFTGVQTITAYQSSIDKTATLRGRFGWALEDMLLYATAGLAAGEVNNMFTLNIPELAYSSPGWSRKGTEYGYVVGGGVEFQVSQRTRLKIEYQMIDLADTTVSGTDEATFPGERIDYVFDNKLSLLKLGLNWNF